MPDGFVDRRQEQPSCFSNLQRYGRSAEESHQAYRDQSDMPFHRRDVGLAIGKGGSEAGSHGQTMHGTRLRFSGGSHSLILATPPRGLPSSMLQTTVVVQCPKIEGLQPSSLL